MRRVYLKGFEAGYVVSNEPGFYKAGCFGIRIESDMVCMPAETRFGFGSRPWLRFETLSLVPISQRLIQPKLMSHDEIAWLNAYHARVYEAILPQLEGSCSKKAGVVGEEDVDYKAWLREATKPIVGNNN